MDFNMIQKVHSFSQFKVMLPRKQPHDICILYYSIFILLHVKTNVIYQIFFSFIHMFIEIHISIIHYSATNKFHILENFTPPVMQ